MGVVNCANSLCHGSVQPWKDANVLQNEYVTWSRVDKHARAYKVLFNEQSARIAKNLGLGNAAEDLGRAERLEAVGFDPSYNHALPQGSLPG